MEASSTDKKTFQFIENGEQLGELIYENMFFYNAAIKLPNAELYEIKPEGFFQSSIAVTNNGRAIAKLAMTWRGQIVINFQDGKEYIIKLSGLLGNLYIIQNKDEENLMQLEPKFNWREFHYNYNIHYNIIQDSGSKDILLVALGVYAANYFIACMSGSSAGMG